MKKIVSILLIVIMIISMCPTVLAGTSSLYKVQNGTKEWANYTTHDEMVAASKVDIAKVKKLSTTKVIYAVLEYPLIVDIFAYDNYEDGIKKVAEECTALQVLLTKADAVEVLEQLLVGDVDLNTILNTSEQNKKIAKQVICVILNFFTQEQQDWMHSHNHILPSLPYTSYYGGRWHITTPNGSEVMYATQFPYLVFGGVDYEDEEALTQAFAAAYPNAEMITGCDYQYNCHSFAWVANGRLGLNNSFWVDDPSIYWEDGSYVQVSIAPSGASMVPTYNCNVAGLNVYYSSVSINGDHSMIVEDSSSSRMSNWTYISKWGAGPVMVCTFEYTPYFEGAYSVNSGNGEQGVLSFYTLAE